MQGKTNCEKLQEIVERLPEFCSNLLLNGVSKGNDYLTPLSYARDLEHFLSFAVEAYPYFCDKTIKDITVDDLSQITVNDINTYLSVMEKKMKLSERTIARRKSSVSRLYRYLTDTERVLQYNPVTGSQKVTIPEQDYVIYLKRPEQERLLYSIMYGTGLTQKELTYHDKEWKRDLAIIYLFLDTGLRISELQRLNIQDLDFTEHNVKTLRKRQKKQEVYFSDAAEEYIRDYLNERRNYKVDDPLFISGRNQRIAIRTIQAMLAKYIRAAFEDPVTKINPYANISPHKLRSSFAMEFYKNQKDILLLQNRMGHKSLLATNIYAKASEKERIAESRNWRNEASHD